jgi:polyhydroxyalkanoate synthase
MLTLWQRFLGNGPHPPAARPIDQDPRFKDDAWRSIPWFDLLRQMYGLHADYLMKLVDIVDADGTTKRKLRFYARQLIDAVAPSNFTTTNPEVVRAAFESRGESLTRGLENMIVDAKQGRVSMTDTAAFEVGRNLAVTEGAVVFENELIQLIQYRPATEIAHPRALLIVPPCINKYYILDLRPENSFVRYAVEQGMRVFVISWRNVSPDMGQLTWDDYLQAGVIRAIDATREITGAAKINALGFCVGGTLLASALAVLRRKRRRPVAALTLLATMLDFADPGEISVYVDEEYVGQCQTQFRDGGIMPGAQLAAAFASLRANDLVWRYVVNNYLKGKQPPPFDLLYWNSDSANLPGAMYTYYVRRMYLENSLREPDRLQMCGVSVDLRRIGLPTYVMAAAEDHIVPWRTAYTSARCLNTGFEFVLAESGHIAGVINPPRPSRRGYRTGKQTDTADQWLATSIAHRGSWWPHWIEWLRARAGAPAPCATTLGNERYRPIEAAPGRYVRETAHAATA